MNALNQDLKNATESRWYALHTKSQHEKLVEQQLQNKGIEAYTPKLSLKRKWSDRTKTIEEPLFKNYCFAKLILLEDKPKILSQRGVVSMVNFHGRCVPIKESVIESLKIMIDNDLKIDPCPHLQEGDEVRVKNGPLKGLKGYILEKRNKNTSLVVSIDAIGASVRCVLDVASIGLV